MLWHTDVSDSAVPAALDWRQKMTLTPVQDQGQCGSCWAFASTQSLSDRFRIALKDASQPLLSVEYVKDCGTKTLAAQYAELMQTAAGVTIGDCDEGGMASMGCEFLEMYGAPTASRLPYSSTTYGGKDVGSCESVTKPVYTALKGSTAVVTLGANGSQPASHVEQLEATLDQTTITKNMLNMQKNILK